jgi:hypothetical protein
MFKVYLLGCTTGLSTLPAHVVEPETNALTVCYAKQTLAGTGNHQKVAATADPNSSQKWLH